MWKLYLVVCEAPNHIYVGITSNMRNRELDHLKGRNPFIKKYGFSEMFSIAEFDSWDSIRKAEKAMRKILLFKGYEVGGGIS